MQQLNILRHLCVLLAALFLSCSSSVHPNEEEVLKEETYLRWVGDIEYNPVIDHSDFQTCNGDDSVIQYFNTGNGPVYPGGKPAVVEIFKSNYKSISDKSQKGLIRIRFIVNCEGRAGRFRILQSDIDFKQTKFDERIVSQLYEITSGIEKWVVLGSEEQPEDYYYYLLFKIVDGDISEILP